MKTFKLIWIGVLVFALAALFLNWQNITEALSESKSGKINPKEAVKVLDKSFDTSTPEGEMPNYKNWSESELIHEVHGMTHQKVKAPQKWGSSEITKDKIILLYDVVQKKSFDDKSNRFMLLEILEPWTRGDFSDAVSDHNTIWNSLHGTVGKATRLSTPGEELTYIEQHFR